MDKAELIKQINIKKSFLCLGLDTDLEKIPQHLKNETDPVFSFNKKLIDELNKIIIAIKINTAFYESRGSEGWISLEKTIQFLSKGVI